MRNEHKLQPTSSKSIRKFGIGGEGNGGDGRLGCTAVISIHPTTIKCTDDTD